MSDGPAAGDLRIGDMLEPGVLLALAAGHGVPATLDTRLADLYAAIAAGPDERA